MTLLVATTNPGKLREIRHALGKLPIELLTLADLADGAEGGSALRHPPAENAPTFWQNARIKALFYARATGHLVVAEDSGLEIAALGGAPGVHSARFLGEDVSYPERFAEIYRRLAQAPDDDRAARFVAALAVARGAELLFETEAAIDGEIAPAPSGAGGFGYDPIFWYPPFGKTTAELTLEEKNAVSHRARAFRDLARWLASHGDAR